MKYTNEKDALKASVLHWKENVKTLLEWDARGFIIGNDIHEVQWYIAGDRVGEDYILHYDRKACALCAYYDFCDICILAKNNEKCSSDRHSTWGKCASAKGNKAIIQAAINMHRLLSKLSKKSNFEIDTKLKKLCELAPELQSLAKGMSRDMIFEGEYLIYDMNNSKYYLAQNKQDAVERIEHMLKIGCVNDDIKVIDLDKICWVYFNIKVIFSDD